MDQVHLHLLLNHLPVVGVIMGVFVLAFGFFTKQPWVKRSALFVIILSALFAVPAYLTGEGAEDSLERVAGFDEAYISPHEDVATLYVWIIGGLAALSLLCWFLDYKKSRFTGFAYSVVFVCALITVGVSARLALTGGEIKHEEIRTGNINTLRYDGGHKEDVD